MGRMFLTMSAGFAELERNLIAERTAGAMQYKKKRLEAYSPVPFGYQRVGDQLIALDDELQTVRWMRRQRQKGHTLRQIACTLNTRKVATKQGRTWHASTVRYVLENNLYQIAA